MSEREEKDFIGRLRALEQNTADIKKDFGTLNKVLLGELADPDKAGVLHTHVQLMKDMYGEGHKNGVLDRLRKIETWQEKKESWLAGAHFVSAGFGSLLGGAVVWLLSKLLKI